jgi:NDP-sugar pyrophosphorylase family protein
VNSFPSNDLAVTGGFEMIAVILAGGKGTRLKPFTMTIPKPLLPLGDIPIIEVVIRQLANAGISDIRLTLGHMMHLFTGFLDHSPDWGVDIQYCVEQTPLGTAGPLRLIAGDCDTFLVMNGDLLTTIDYRDLLETHHRRKAWATIAVQQRKVQIDYGVLTIDGAGQLQDYREKPSIEYNVSMGINVLSKECLEFIPPGQKFDMPELMLALRNAGKPVVCYQTNCYWQDIGRFDDYRQASEDFVHNPDRFLAVPGDRDENRVDHGRERVLRSPSRKAAA